MQINFTGWYNTVNTNIANFTAITDTVTFSFPSEPPKYFLE